MWFCSIWAVEQVFCSLSNCKDHETVPDLSLVYRAFSHPFFCFCSILHSYHRHYCFSKPVIHYLIISQVVLQHTSALRPLVLQTFSLFNRLASSCGSWIVFTLNSSYSGLHKCPNIFNFSTFCHTILHCNVMWQTITKWHTIMKWNDYYIFFLFVLQIKKLKNVGCAKVSLWSKSVLCGTAFIGKSRMFQRKMRVLI